VSCRTSIRKITIATGKVDLIAGHLAERGTSDGVGSAARFWSAVGIAIDNADARLFVCDYSGHSIRQVTLSSGAYAPLQRCILDQTTDTHHIIFGVAGAVTTIAGDGKEGDADGVSTRARFNCPRAIAFDEQRGGLFVSDNHRIRFISLATGLIRTGPRTYGESI
jgi:hypothetical protein